MIATRQVKLEPAVCCLCGVEASEVVTQGRDYEHDTVPPPLTMVRCARCGIYYLNPRPTADSLDVIYPEDYMSHQFTRQASRPVQWAKNWVYRRRGKKIARYVASDDAMHIFEVGCGEGVFLRALKETIGNPRWKLSGCELKQEVTAQIGQSGVEVHTGRFEDLALPENGYDLVLMLHVIEHMDNPQSVLQKAWSITKPGGYLVVETPNSNSLDARLFEDKYWFDYQFPRHFYIFNSRNLVSTIELAGFRVEAIVRQVGPMVWTNSIRNWLQDHPRWRFALPLFSRWNPLALSFFTTVDLVLKQFRETSRIQVVARKPTE